MSNILTALNASVSVNRKDQPGQPFWTQWQTGLVVAGGTSADAGCIPMLDANGKLASSLMPSSALLVEVNGVAAPNQSVANFIAGTNIVITSDVGGGIHISASGSIGTSFDNISTGDNSTGIMTVSGSAAVTYSGSGVVNANQVGGINVAGNSPTHEGQLLISQPGNASAVWADPMVQGLYPEGSSVASPPPFAVPTHIQPVLIGGKTKNTGVLQSLPLTQDGSSIIVAANLQAQSLTGSVDAYERLRVSNPISIFDTDYNYYATGDMTVQEEPLFDSHIVGSGSIVRPAFEPCVQLSIGGDAGAIALWQTKAFFPAQVGKGLQIIQFGLIGSNVPNVTKRLGFYEDSGGWFFEQNGTTGTLRVVTRTSASGTPTDVGTDQINWNIDKMNGTGPSGITLDPTRYQVWVIESGALRVRFGVFMAGVLYFVHQNVAANLVTAVFTAAASFPVRKEVFNTAASAGSSLKSANASVIIDGGFEDNPSPFACAVNTGDTLATITAPTPLLSIRPTLTIAGRTNRAFITIRDFNVISAGQIMRYQLIYNGALTDASFSQVDASAVEADTSATAITGGHVVDSGFIGVTSKDTTFAGDKFTFRLPFTLDFAGVEQDVYTIVVSPVNGGTVMAGASFKWQELR